MRRTTVSREARSRSGSPYGRSRSRLPGRVHADHPQPRGEFWTDDELLELGAASDRKQELWYGEIMVMPPAGARHGDIIARLLAAVAGHVYGRRLGRVYDGQTGFRLSLENCFEPDLAFVSTGRLKLILPAADKLFHGAPDLAVEVLSPNDSITATEQKIRLYLAHGTRLAWLVDPRTRSVRVYRPDNQCERLDEGRILTGNGTLPGFRLPLQRLFEDI